MDDNHARLFFRPHIWITAEHAADILSISLEKADRLLSGEQTRAILQQALSEALQQALLTCLQQMARIPQETIPTPVDCAVRLPDLPVLKGVI